jgi:hypothetical protein
MFVANRTGIACTLARARLTEELGALSVNVEMRYSLAENGALLPLGAEQRTRSDPPDLGRLVLWRGCSLTAWGHVLGAASPPHVRRVRLSAGGIEHQLLVFGERRWLGRRFGALEASEPSPFDRVPLDWSLAFGGWFDMPPGLAPGTDLPHPGGRVAYPLNPDGIGFYRDDAAASNQLLPQVELADHRVKTPSDRPRPGGLAPCPALSALRLAPSPSAARVEQGIVARAQPPHDVESPAANPAEVSNGFWPTPLDSSEWLRQALRLQHHAPGALILDEVVPSSPCVLEGLGGTPIAFSVPAPPVSASVRQGRGREPLRAKVRAMHIDADARTLRVAFGHFHGYRAARPPQWVELSERNAS